MSIAPGVTPANADPNDLIVDVVTSSGTVVAVDDPALIEMLCEGLRGENHLTLVRSDRALTDCRPVSLISLQTIRQVEAELGIPLDKRRFRANVYLNLASDTGFAEDELVGRKLRIGARAVRWFWNATRAVRLCRSTLTRANTTRKCYARSSKHTGTLPVFIAPC
jgi:hypothetical protein